MPTRPLQIAFLGFGTVGRALHALLARRRDELAQAYGVDCVITGVASKRAGWRAQRGGLDPLAPAPQGLVCDDIHDWLSECGAEVVFEAIPLDPIGGQPALDYLRAVLDHGANAISANKGPLVHGYRELTALARSRGVGYRFESAVMDGAPVFSLLRSCLPLAGVHSVQGVFTSTATVVLEAVERGATIDEGIAEAQRLGIAEADPGYDVDGWDSAVKLCAVANVLLGGALKPADVERHGIRDLNAGEVRRACTEGRPYRLVGSVRRTTANDVSARVMPMQCSPDGPLGIVRGATLVMHYEADVFPGGLTITSCDPDPTTTAYGMLSDLVALLEVRPDRPS